MIKLLQQNKASPSLISSGKATTCLFQSSKEIYLDWISLKVWDSLSSKLFDNSNGQETFQITNIYKSMHLFPSKSVFILNLLEVYANSSKQ